MVPSGRPVARRVPSGVKARAVAGLPAWASGGGCLGTGSVETTRPDARSQSRTPWMSAVAEHSAVGFRAICRGHAHPRANTGTFWKPAHHRPRRRRVPGEPGDRCPGSGFPNADVVDVRGCSFGSLVLPGPRDSDRQITIPGKADRSRPGSVEGKGSSAGRQPIDVARGQQPPAVPAHGAAGGRRLLDPTECYPGVARVVPPRQRVMGTQFVPTASRRTPRRPSRQSGEPSANAPGSRPAGIRPRVEERATSLPESTSIITGTAAGSAEGAPRKPAAGRPTTNQRPGFRMGRTCGCSAPSTR